MRDSVCVLIPTYNNAPTVKSVVEECKLYCSNIFVVNDGSTDNTLQILQSIENIVLITYPQNRGKGAALTKGLAKATEMGFKYCITIDSDGQHYPNQIPLFIKKIEEEPGSLIIGARNLNARNMPGKNTFANKFSNFWYKVETWKELSDTQSGFRLYPLDSIKDIRLFSGKYEFELEIIVRAAWRGVNVINIPIDVYYPPQGERISHFKPLRDFTRISILNTILVTIAILWYYPKKFIMENIINNRESNLVVSASLGYGIFCGIIPIWGYQMVFAGVSAHFLKLNKVLAILASNISVPPMIPFILVGCMYAGGILLGKDVTLPPLDEIDIEFVCGTMVQYIIGSIAFAAVAGASVFVTAYVLLQFIIRRKR